MLCRVCNKNQAVRIQERKRDGKIVREYYCSACFSRFSDGENLNGTNSNGAVTDDLTILASSKGKYGKNVGTSNKSQTQKIAENCEGEKSEIGEKRAFEEKERFCPFCGTTARRYNRSKLLGCAECYRYLFGEIEESVLKMQGNEPHKGKTPEKGGGV